MSGGDQHADQERGRRGFLLRLLGFLGVGGLALGGGLIFTVQDTIQDTQKTNEILTCENRIEWAEQRADTHWLLCLKHENQPWSCRVRP